MSKLSQPCQDQQEHEAAKSLAHESICSRTGTKGEEYSKPRCWRTGIAHLEGRMQHSWNRNRNNATPQLEGPKDFPTKSQRSPVCRSFVRFTLWPWDLRFERIAGWGWNGSSPANSPRLDASAPNPVPFGEQTWCIKNCKCLAILIYNTTPKVKPSIPNWNSLAIDVQCCWKSLQRVMFSTQIKMWSNGLMAGAKIDQQASASFCFIRWTCDDQCKAK